MEAPVAICARCVSSCPGRVQLSSPGRPARSHLPVLRGRGSPSVTASWLLGWWPVQSPVEAPSAQRSVDLGLRCRPGCGLGGCGLGRAHSLLLLPPGPAPAIPPPPPSSFQVEWLFSPLSLSLWDLNFVFLIISLSLQCYLRSGGQGCVCWFCRHFLVAQGVSDPTGDRDTPMLRATCGSPPAHTRRTGPQSTSQPLALPARRTG